MPDPAVRIRPDRRRAPGCAPRPSATRFSARDYAVKEIFYTLQGEGAQAGRPAVFCRFAGCNLWTGRRRDRARAVCRFCDTDFVGTDGPGGGSFATAEELAERSGRGVAGGGGSDGRWWSAPAASRCCSWTRPLIAALHQAGFEVAVETNGTQPAPPGLDWICVSPKAGALWCCRRGTSSSWSSRKRNRRRSRHDSRNSTFRHFFLQPMDGPDRDANTATGAGLLPGPPAVAAEPADP